MPEVLKVLVIPTDQNEPVAVRTLSPEGDGSYLRALQEIVDGLVQALPFPGRDDHTTYSNEEGKYTCERNERATALMMPVLFARDFIAGNLIVCGFDPIRGVNRDVDPEVANDLVARFVF